MLQYMTEEDVPLYKQEKELKIINKMAEKNAKLLLHATSKFK